MASFRLALLLSVLALGLIGCGGGDGPPAASPEPREPPGRGEPEPETSGGEPRLETVATGLEAPWEIAFLPDGRALVTERPGRVRLLEADGTLRDDPVAEVDVEAVGEGGLLGLAIDPEFESNGFVYLYRTTDDGNEVARFRFEDGRLEEEATIVEGIDYGAVHNGGRIHFGPDGLLYVSTGDAGDSERARDPESLNGKLLRTDAFRGEGERPEIVSSGHRNVQGFDWEPDSRRLLATEFGDDDHDEVNVIRPGLDYGWPEAEGRDGAGNGLEPPLVDYEDVIAPSGATFVARPGSAWTGSFLIACLRGTQVRRLALEGGEVTADEALLEGRLGRLRTVVEAPDGGLYALTSNRDGRGSPSDGDDRIVRIVPPRA
jgi:glucose/arabinose dehydrogenase